MLESSKGYESQRYVSLECLNFSLSFYWAEKTECTRFPFQCVLLSSATDDWLTNSWNIIRVNASRLKPFYIWSLITFVNYFSVCLLYSSSTDPVLARVQTPHSLWKNGSFLDRLIPCALRYNDKTNEKLLLPPYPCSILKHAHIQEKGRQAKLKN